MTPDLASSQGIEAVRAEFPILAQRPGEAPLIYLDSAATSLKPRAVIEAVLGYYTRYTANVHRAVHRLSEEATEAFEGARSRIAAFIGAEPREIVFVRGATEALNLVAASLPPEARVAVAEIEHHSNLLPWRQRRIIPLAADAAGLIDLDQAETLLRRHSPALLTASMVGNAFGTRQPVDQLAALARSRGAAVLLDVSQSVGHERLDMARLDCDFACFSGHKMLGPGGVGVLYVRTGSERMLQPLQWGGSMISSVSADSHELQSSPWCFEAGTPNIEGVIGLGAACDFLDWVDVEAVDRHTQSLGLQLRGRLASMRRLKLAGSTPAGVARILTFSVTGMQAHAVARLLSDRFGIMARSGFHCAQPLHLAGGFPETVRMSLHCYNTAAEMDACAEALELVCRMP